MPTILAITAAACLSEEGGDAVDESAARLESPSGSTGDIAATCTLPPGGLVDTQAQSAWTEGSLSVTDDGAATYHLPLWLPKGRGGLTPELALSYHSRAGNGPIGVGWSLSGLSAITPCSRTLAQDGRIQPPLFGTADVYCLDGQRLRPVSDQPAEQREYRTERETFSRIIALSDALPGGGFTQPSTFKVWTKDGRIFTYGSRTTPCYDRTGSAASTGRIPASGTRPRARPSRSGLSVGSRIATSMT